MMVTTMPSGLSVEELTFGFGRPGSAQFTRAVQNLSISIDAGEVVGILGPNGSGKSTFLKLLAKVLIPQRGSITLFGQPYDSLSQVEIALRVALVPQETHQVFPFTIREMVLMGRFPHYGRSLGFRWESANDREIATQSMRDMDVCHLGARLITDVSGGERQRAIIARALTQEPEVLLLDEPTAFLDLHHQLDIARTIRRLNQERGITVILVSHDLNLASQYCDRLVLLQDGAIVKVGLPQEVITQETLEPVYGCQVLIDRHPQNDRPRVTLPV